jgi:hypothetical protein
MRRDRRVGFREGQKEEPKCSKVDDHFSERLQTAAPQHEKVVRRRKQPAAGGNVLDARNSPSDLAMKSAALGSRVCRGFSAQIGSTVHLARSRKTLYSSK